MWPIHIPQFEQTEWKSTQILDPKIFFMVTEYNNENHKNANIGQLSGAGEFIKEVVFVLTFIPLYKPVMYPLFMQNTF